jgi:hypothetical protein
MGRPQHWWKGSQGARYGVGARGRWKRPCKFPILLLCATDHRGAGFIMREQQGWPFEMRTPLRPRRRVETGKSAAQRVQVVDGQGVAQTFRRLRAVRPCPKHDGSAQQGHVSTANYSWLDLGRLASPEQQGPKVRRQGPPSKSARTVYPAAGKTQLL